MARRGHGGISKGIVGALVVTSSIVANGHSRGGTWFRVCGWSVIATFASIVPIASYNFAPGLGIAGLILAAASLATFVVTLFFGLIIGLGS